MPGLGRQIGRKKLRDSDLIRKLLKAGMSYRAISSVARCSHGSVHAERVAMKKEEAELQRKQEELAKAEKAMHDPTVVFPDMPSPT